VKLSVVVPVHNEIDNIKPLIAEIVHALDDQHDYEMIFVNDASTDHTLYQLKKMMQRYPHLRVLTHSICCGQSTALSTGIKAASSPVIATLDGDGQNDPKDIPELVKAFFAHQAEGEVIIAGYRKNRQDTKWKKISSKIANTVRKTILNDDTLDTGCALKIFSKDLFLSLPYFDHMHRFLPALAKRTGAKVISVDVNHRPRAHGTSSYGTIDRLKAGLVDLAGVYWLMKRAKSPGVTEETIQNEQ